jgi:hypothetical protein
MSDYMLFESGSRSKDCLKVLRLNSRCLSVPKYWNIWTLIVKHGRKSWVCDMADGACCQEPSASFLKLPAASCRESSTVRNAAIFQIRLLTPQQAAGNALAIAVQNEHYCSLASGRDTKEHLHVG